MVTPLFHVRRVIALAPILLALCFAACGESSQDDEGDASEPQTQVLPVGGSLTTYSVCSSTFTKATVVQMFNGNLVFATDNTDKGASLSEMLGSVLINIVANGLDFSEPYKFSFKDGDYTYTNGTAGYTFSLYFAEDFGEFHADDKIPYDMFSASSYVTGVSLSGFPNVSLDYDEGPLFDLIEGSVDYDVKNLADVSVKFRIAGEKIKFALSSTGDSRGQEPRTDDILHLVITSTPLTLTSLADQIATQGFGMSYTGTTYDSVYYKVKQNFVDTTFFVKTDAVGFYFEGPFNSVVVKNGVTMWQTGLLSQRQQNFASYYCDESLSQLLGIARHDLDLKGGTFEFADGTTLRYGLQNF